MLNREIADAGLHAGDVGVVVMVYANGKAYEVEFVDVDVDVDGDGSTVALLTLEAEDVRPIQAGELLHARQRD